MIRTIRHIFSLVISLAGIGMLTWALWPGQHQELSQYIEPEGMRLPSAGQTASPAVKEMRQVRLEWPELLRIGDRGTIILIFQPVESDNHSTEPGTRLSDVYESYNLMAEGRLELTGMTADPANPVRESMPAGQTIKLKWQVSTLAAQVYPVKIWLSLRFLPLDGSQASEVPIFVRAVEIHAESLLGLGGAQARLVGGLGVIVGLALSCDVMISNIKKITTKGTKDTKVTINK